DGGVGGTADSEILARLIKLETENKKLKSLAEDVKKITNNVNQLISRMSALEKGVKAPSNTSASQISQKSEEKPKKKDDDDVDLFGSDEEEDADMLKIKADRLKMYEDKKAKKPGVIAKSNIILDVKPWDDETNMKTMEDKVRLVTCDGLLWGASKLVPLAYGIHKLQISCVIEDEKVSVDWLQEQIEANEDLVQSVDIAAFNKV
uniref:Translation elongation factor EF1B beta/delta subunit guanine nucleotide exchange domain-containing protein n=1 Tax=Strigamia maritima TaxID=126957 RepID=T1JB50_STRMM